MSVYTHGHHESVLRSHRWRTVENSAAYLIPHLRPGQALLDVGCGPGTITADFAKRLSPGRVCGIEKAERTETNWRRSRTPGARGPRPMTDGLRSFMPTSFARGDAHSR